MYDMHRLGLCQHPPMALSWHPALLTLILALPCPHFLTHVFLTLLHVVQSDLVPGRTLRMIFLSSLRGNIFPQAAYMLGPVVGNLSFLSTYSQHSSFFLSQGPESLPIEDALVPLWGLHLF